MTDLYGIYQDMIIIKVLLMIITAVTSFGFLLSQMNITLALNLFIFAALSVIVFPVIKKIKSFFSSADSISAGEEKSPCIQHDKIKSKKMYYNLKETDGIQKLISILTEENFRKIQDRLDDKGMNKGFACLFSGSPGTGKTETAYQIAKETKRDIMMVDISDTKSLIFGGDQKNIKEVFDNYREAVKNSGIAPILLLNEADAIISKRKELDGSSRAIDKDMNATQNVILQEMESFQGILIATTNLIQNLDKAFDRRFLYKITFDKPGPDNRKDIWNSLLPDLQEVNAMELARKFEFSGGQIENIARKVEVDNILSCEEINMDRLIQYCRDENFNVLNREKSIGFMR